MRWVNNREYRKRAVIHFKPIKATKIFYDR